jgi:hypothetical protein
MSKLVKVKNITKGKLVFLAVRGPGDLPLTLEAGEEKDIFPSMASQPSLQAVKGTKVLFISDEVPEAVKPKEVVAPAPVVVVEPIAPPVDDVTLTDEPDMPTTVADASSSPEVVEPTPTTDSHKKFSRNRR